jgi:hypothetical protein
MDMNEVLVGLVGRVEKGCNVCGAAGLWGLAVAFGLWFLFSYVLYHCQLVFLL